MGHLTHYTCPVTGCPRTKAPEQVACGTHWLEIPRELRYRIELLQRSPAGAELRRSLVVRVVDALNAPPGPDRRWSALMREEHGRLADEAAARASRPVGDVVSVTGRLLYESSLAVRVELADGRDLWVPKNPRVLASHESRGDGTLHLWVAQWFAKREGLVRG